MIAQWMIGGGAALFGMLGALHVAYTFLTHKFEPRDRDLFEKMKTASMVITRGTTFWRAWVGFNASHSMGVMIYATLYMTLAVRHVDVLRATPAIAWCGVAIGLAYLLLAQRYWFRVPLVGIAIGTVAMLVGTLML